jgi:hypothetical protein
MDNFYYKIVISEYKEAKSYYDKITKHQDSGEPEHIIDMNVYSARGAQAKKNLVVVVFSVMMLESFIFQYGAEYIGKSYFKNHLEKLNLVSKFLITPQLVVQKSIDKSSRAYGALKKIVTNRHYLVHHKQTGDRAGYSIDFYKYVESASENAINAIHWLIGELDSIHKVIPTFSESVLNTNECHA